MVKGEGTCGGDVEVMSMSMSVTLRIGWVGEGLVLDGGGVWKNGFPHVLRRDVRRGQGRRDLRW